MIDFKCPKCKQPMTSPESMAGQEETCPNCGNVAVVPYAAPPVPVQATPIQQIPQPPPTNVAPQVRLDINVKGIKSTSGLGIAALVLGILAVLTCWIPFVGILGIPLAVLGLIFGVIGFLIALIGRKSSVGMPMSGCIVCIVGIIVAVASTGGMVAAVDKAKKEAHEPKESLSGNSVVTDEQPTQNKPNPAAKTMPARGLLGIDANPVDGQTNLWPEDKPEKQLIPTVAPISVAPRGENHHSPLSPSGLASPSATPANDKSSLPEKPSDAEKKAYLAKVLLKNVEIGKTVLGGKGVFGEIKNAGNRALREVATVVYCLDRNGKAVFEKTFHPVLVSDSVFSLRDKRQLKPHYSEKFGYELDDAPSEWAGQVRVVISNIEFADVSAPSDTKLDGAKKAYVGKVLLNNIEVGKSVLDEQGVFGEVKNTGDRLLKEVEVVIYCLDKYGKAVFEKTYHPVLVTDSGFSIRNDNPLKPNYSQKFGCKLDNAPSEWSGKVRVIITNIEFAD